MAGKRTDKDSKKRKKVVRGIPLPEIDESKIPKEKIEALKIEQERLNKIELKLKRIRRKNYDDLEKDFEADIPKPTIRPQKKDTTETKPKRIHNVPVAVPAKNLTEYFGAIALVTKTKYVINRWWHLKAGEEIIAPRSVIDSLRNAGLVK